MTNAQNPSINAWKIAYEIDTVVQTREKNELTLTDCKSRHQLIRLIPNSSASAVNQALLGILEDYKIKSITADNVGNLHTCLIFLIRRLFYYVHPYASWEQDTHENHNRLIQ